MAHWNKATQLFITFFPVLLGEGEQVSRSEVGIEDVELIRRAEEVAVTGAIRLAGLSHPSERTR